jgi:GNAT superfamily N-acetyltransferase
MASPFQIRDMEKSDEYYVGTCTHVHESKEIDRGAERRIEWLRSTHGKGVRVKVALVGGKRVGFLHLVPIEICPWGPLGQDLMVIPCLVVQETSKGKGIGRALLRTAEEEALRQNLKGLVTVAYYHNFWFMPAPFFESCGFSSASQIREPTREGEKEYLSNEALLWKVLDSSASAPHHLEARARSKLRHDKVVVQLFWNTFCQTSNIEAERVRRIAAEFGDAVVLREYCTDDPVILRRYQTPRAILIDGTEIGWGYEAPEEGIRTAIAKALRAHQSEKED